MSPQESESYLKWVGERNEGVTPEELTMTTSLDLRLASCALEMARSHIGRRQEWGIGM